MGILKDEHGLKDRRPGRIALGVNPLDDPGKADVLVLESGQYGLLRFGDEGVEGDVGARSAT
ncbi:hypothetical protein D3C72_2444580 [compost metagenome]